MGISGKQLNGRRRPQLALPVQAGSCALRSLQGASLPSPPCLKDCPRGRGGSHFQPSGRTVLFSLISSARYLDCRNRGTRFLLRDFARGLSSRRGKHPEQQGKQEKHKPLRGKSVHACSYASSHQHRDPRGLFSARLQQQQIDTGRN